MTRIERQDGSVETLKRMAQVDPDATTSADGVTRVEGGQVAAPGRAERSNRSRVDVSGR